MESSELVRCTIAGNGKN